jgi:hypothetical protein
MASPKQKRPPDSFRVGDRIRFTYGVTPVEGVIVEDRGHIGVGGRRLWRIWFRLDEYNEYHAELPEALIERVS